MFYEVWPLGVSFDSTYFVEFDKKLLVWDLLSIDGKYFLVFSNNRVWKQIPWVISYLGNLFTPRTLFFQKFFANFWYTWYFKTFSLFVSDKKYIWKYKLPEIKRFSFDMTKTYKTEYSNFEKYEDYLKLWDKDIKTLYLKDFSSNLLDLKSQNLLIFPDDWTMFNLLERFKVNADILDVSSTALTKYKMFISVKTNKTKVLATTSAGIFQDWKKLNSIFLFFPYKWYYKSQQNPRYYVPELVKQIKFFYDVENVYFIYP